MSNILASLSSASQSFSSLEQAMQVIANNTTNATTPGYAKQRQVLEANSFNPANGSIGGVTAGPILSSRDAYSELNVQNAQASLNYSTTISQHLQAIDPLFSLAGADEPDISIGSNLNQFFVSISQLTVSPNDSAIRQAVLSAGQNLASAFNSTYQGLASAQTGVGNDIVNTVNSINSIVSDIQQINADKRKDLGARDDAGIDARLYSDLESLSQLVNFTSVQAADGTTNIYLGGQSALLIGTTQNALTTTNVGSGGTSQMQVLDSSGDDVSWLATSGKLGGLVGLENTTIPGYMSQLNNLAKGVADTINTQLAQGKDLNGNVGAAMFTYSAGGAAQSLALTSITASQLAAASSSGSAGNGNAVALSGLQSTPIAALGDFTFVQYYGNLAFNVGTDSSNAQNSGGTQQQLLAQAQTLRSSLSSVSLDEEATLLTEYQQAYDATSKLITIINQMVQTALGLIPSA
jgi:flagellar hook-associated protein 1 FlgK